tara:strand:- start:698 stop:1495 length:798 start_codon:yes stop_codon:yes gene_type:complete
MALPSSGVLTLADIQTEFGGTNPIGLSEYYRGGGLVPNTTGNAGIPTSGVISVTDFYGAANTIALNLATHGTGTNGASISIGTARSTRMVHLSGFTTNATSPTSGTIGGVTATVINTGTQSPNGFAGNTWQAYAKVPTGTTATVSMSTAVTYYVATFDTVNSGASATTSQTGSGATKTATLTAANPGVCFWGGHSPAPQNFTPAIGLSTNSPGGVTAYYITSTANTALAAGYNITSTTVSQTFSVSIPAGKLGGAGALWSIFSAN